MARSYKSYGRRSATRRRFRRSFGSRGKRSYARKITVAKAAGVTDAVWAELTDTERSALLERKRQAVLAALERNITLQQLSGRAPSSSHTAAYANLKDDAFEIEIAKLAKTDH